MLEYEVVGENLIMVMYIIIKYLWFCFVFLEKDKIVKCGLIIWLVYLRENFVGGISKYFGLIESWV